MLIATKLVLTAWLAAVAISDLRNSVIPNRLTLPAAAVVMAIRLGQTLWYALYSLALWADRSPPDLRLGQTLFGRWPADPQAPWRLGAVLGIWVLLFLLWELNIIGGGDAKLLMGLFALFPTGEFVLVFSALVLVLSLPYLIAKYWRQNPVGVVQMIAFRVLKGLFPTREELEREGRPLAWTYCVPGVVYLWWLW